MKQSQKMGAQSASGWAVRLTTVAVATVVAALCLPFLHPREVEQKSATALTAAELSGRVGVTVRRGETLALLLMRFGIKPPSAHALIERLRPFFNPRKIQPGQDVHLLLSPEDNSVQSVEFVMQDSLIRVKATADGWLAERRQIPSVRETRVVHGTIKENLYQSGIDAGLTAQQIFELVKIFEYDVDFFSDLHPGDAFAVVVEEARYADNTRRPGRIVAAQLDMAERELSAFYYITTEGSGAYYDADGRALQRSFLRAPLSYARVSSPFATERSHPIFRTVRAHEAIDYAAPMGTPVVAVGDGRVEFAGWQNGYGNIVDVGHPAGYVSRYAHFSRLAAGMREGKSVQAGEVIGYVGQTGHTTGPHLHFELLRGEERLNFLTLQFPKIEALSGRNWARFKRLRDQRLALLGAEGKGTGT